jgi:hypothetical protein
MISSRRPIISQSYMRSPSSGECNALRLDELSGELRKPGCSVKSSGINAGEVRPSKTLAESLKRHFNFDFGCQLCFNIDR